MSYVNENNTYFNGTFYYKKVMLKVFQERKNNILLNENNISLCNNNDILHILISSKLWEYPELKLEMENYAMELIKHHITNKDLYNKLNIFYTKHSIKPHLSKSRAKKRIKHIDRYIDGNVSNYLDIGCFDGSITYEVGKHFNLEKDNINGIDIQEYNNYENITFSKYDGSTLPYNNNNFNLITCYMVLHHIKKDNLNKLIKEIYRVMEKGGILILREHNVTNKYEEKLINYMHDFYDYVWDTKNMTYKKWENNYKTANNWTKILVDSGFKIKKKPYLNNTNNPFNTYMCSYIK